MLFESGHVILFTRYTLKSASISIIPEFIEKLELMGKLDLFIITKDTIECKLTGSKIIFKGIRTSSGVQTANLKSLQGVTTWILDESEELMSEEIFDKIDLSIRQKGRQNRIVLILNPATKTHWIYKKFFEDKGINEGSNITYNNTTYIHTTYLDNIKNLDKSFIDIIEEVKIKNPVKYNHVILGGWLDKAEGVIYTDWEIGDFNNDLPYGYGMDFGFSIDPTTLIKVAVDNKNRIIYIDEIFTEYGKTTSELYKLMNKDNKQVIADNAEGRLIEELKRMGINIKPCIKGAGSIATGIKLIQDYKLIVTQNSTNVIKELNNYTWSDKKSDTPIDMYNHTLDSIRYYVSHMLKASKGVYNF